MLKKFLIFSFLFIIFINLCYTNINATSNKTLKFNSDGNFKIVVFADCQDDSIPYFEMIQLMEYALDTEKPDLVLFTGDNIITSNEADFKTGATALLEPLIKRNTPYAYTFGNHDDEFGVSKEYMHEIYMSLVNYLIFDANPS
jgi:predicted MPP superfamily phosphohydrolase